MKPVIRPHGSRSNSRKNRAPKVYTQKRLAELQSRDLDFKEDFARKTIEKALKKIGNPSVAFSGGKDSTVLLHMIRDVKPDVHVIYGNTTIEFPESVKFARKLANEWRLNYHEATPEVSFWWITRNYGWPLLGKTFGVGGVAHKESRAKFFSDLKASGPLPKKYRIQSEVPISSACCTFLKERPSQKLQKKLGVDGVFLGILASESRQRMFNFLKYGELYHPKTQKVWKAHPLSIWTDNDIWKYIRNHNIPYCDLYDKGFYDETGKWIAHKRNGCMFCGMDLRYPNNHLAIMRRTHPRIWHILMRKMGLGEILLQLHHSIYRQYDLFADIMPLDDYLDSVPCAFDRI